MIRVAAIILAGGKGERLGGVVKANLEIGGVRLIERVTAALGSLPRPVIVAHGGIPPDALGLLPEQVPVADLATDHAGPLAGVAAAADYCARLPAPPDALVTIAVDTPFVPADYVERMLAALDDGAPAVVARYGAQDYPTNMIWRLATLARLPQRLIAATSPHSLRRLAAEVGAVPLDWPESADGDPFANVNTPDDLAAMETRAGRR